MKIYYTILYLSSLFCFSQNDSVLLIPSDSLGQIKFEKVTKYIEVQVRDSIQLEYTRSNILVGINKFRDNHSWEDYGALRLDESKQQQDKLTLEAFFKNQKISFKHLMYVRNGTEIYPEYQHNYLIKIDLHNEKKMHALYELDFANIFIVSNSYKNEDKVDEILFEKIINNAKAKASKIAKIAGVKIGKIIEIKEETLQFEMNTNSYEFEKKRAARVKFSID